jgi:hypothetical protein
MANSWQQNLTGGVPVPWLDRRPRARYRIDGSGAESCVTYGSLAEAHSAIAARSAELGQPVEVFRVRVVLA